MNLILAGLTWQACLCFLDDVIVFAHSFEAHLERLKAVFDRIRAANLKLRPDKCHLFRTRVRFLGFYISKSGLEADPERVRAIKEYGDLKSVSDVRTFCGLVSYYRRFIKDCALLCSPLTELLRSKAVFSWDARRE